MADASYLQSSFLGGEWSSFFSGRMDDQRYRSALAVCRNAYPLEEGCWTRRPGFRFLGTTRAGVQAELAQFAFNQAQPYVMEFTPGHLRMWTGNQLVLTGIAAPVLSISTANPAVITTLTAHGYSTGDSIQFVASGGTGAGYGVSAVMNRTFVVTVLTTTTYSIADPVTGAGFNGSTVSLGTSMILSQKVLDLATSYTAAQIAARSIRVIQAVNGTETIALVLCPGVPPYVLTNVTQASAAGDFATFTWGAVVFEDGPYLDLVNDGSYLTPSASSGVITLTVAYNAWSASVYYSAGEVVLYSGVAYTSLQDNNYNEEPDVSTSYWASSASPSLINNGQGFLATDVGRMVRLFSEPLNWVGTTAYTVGATVKYDGGYWTCLANNTNVPPNTSDTDWAVSTTAAAWTWGRIVGYTNAAVVSLQLIGGTLLNGTNAVYSWQLGVFSGSTTYPTCGAYHEGRLWLGGAVANRFDASSTDNIFEFTPTGLDGTVADDNGISEVLNSSRVNAILWMISTHQGLVMGTQAGEWLIQASALNDPITPTSIQAHNVTKFGCQNVEPVETPLSIVFVQRAAKRMIEYIADAYTGKFSGTNVALTAKHLTAPGIARIAYQQEATPVVWAVMNDGSLAGMTYKRESPFGTQPASFAGWHRHDRNDGRTFWDIVVGPSQGGVLDALTVCSVDNGVYWVEVLTDLFDEDTPLTNAWFLDGSSPATGAEVDTTVNPNLLRMQGFEYAAGQSLDVWAGGLDLGTYVVSATGEIDVPINTPTLADGLFTQSYLATLTAEGNIFGEAGQTVTVINSNPTQNPPTMTAVQDFTWTGGATYTDAGWMDWNGGVSYCNTNGLVSGNAGGWYKFTLANGAQTDYVAAFGVANVLNRLVDGCKGTDGYYYAMGDYINQGVMIRQDPTTFAVLANQGTPGSLEPFTLTGGFPLPVQYCPIQVGGEDFLIYTSLYSVTPNVVVFMNAPMWGIAGYNTPFDQAWLAPFPNFSTGSFTYGGVYGISATYPSPTNLDIFAVIITTAPTSKYPGAQIQDALRNVGSTPGYEFLGTITPSAILTGGATITTGPGFLCFDQADHQLITAVTMSTGQTYLIKINPQTCSITWKIAINSPSWSDNGAFYNQSRIKGHMAIFLQGSGGQYMTWIDTLAGTILSSTLVPGIGFGGMAYDGFTSQIVLSNCNLTTASGMPTPIGSTPTTFSNKTAVFYGLPPTSPTSYFVPMLAGTTFTSQGQLLRPIQPPETGARNGPALGKTRRSHMFSANIFNTGGLSFGSGFTTQYTVPNVDATGAPLSLLTMQAGVVQGTLDDDYTFNSQPAWQITRPYPGTVLDVEAFLHTQDR